MTINLINIISSYTIVYYFKPINIINRLKKYPNLTKFIVKQIIYHITSINFIRKLFTLVFVINVIIGILCINTDKNINFTY